MTRAALDGRQDVELLPIGVAPELVGRLGTELDRHLGVRTRIAPPIEPTPPITQAMKAFNPGVKPSNGSIWPNFPPHISPATAASPEPMANAARIVRLTDMPIRRAAVRFSAVARIALPSRVR